MTDLRRHERITLDLEKVGALLAELGVTSDDIQWAWVSGGYTNSNIRVHVDGRSSLLKIFTAGEAKFRTECRVRQLPNSNLPVPHLLAHRAQPATVAYPVMLTEWVDGTSLEACLAGANPQQSFEMGDELAGALAAMQRLSLPEPTYEMPDLEPYITKCLHEQGAARHLAAATVRALESLLKKSHGFLLEQAGGLCLVHGDFKGDNLLMSGAPQAGQTVVVSAIVDWEWGHQGSQLSDLAVLLRHTAEGAPLEQGVESGLRRRGAFIGVEWRRAARLVDLAAQCERLTSLHHRGRFTEEAIQLITRTVDSERLRW